MDNRTEEFRQQPPAPLAPRPLNLPTPEETALQNGLRVVVVEENRLPLVSFRLAFRTGDAFDPPELSGLTDIMTSMLTEGTETLNSRQLADEVARLGATLSAGASSDYSTVAASALAPYSERVLELLADVALNPSFPSDELELTKQNAQQNLIAQRGQASFLASEMVARVVFGEHPYGIVSPTPESIERMSSERLADFHRKMFVPNNAVLFVVGDVRREPLLTQVERLFGGWQVGEIAAANFPAPPVRSSRTLYMVDRPDSAQSNIVIANTAITRTHPDYFPLLVMHTVLGATASSRLFMNLREEKGYTYGAYSSLDARRTAGTFRATAEVRTQVTGASLKEFFYELEHIRAENVSEKELQDAKSYLTGVFPIRLETQEGIIDQLVQIKMHGLPEDYLHTYRERVGAVTVEEVRRVANEHIRPDRAAIVVVGDAASLAEQVAPYAAEIEVYDSTGQRKETGAGSSNSSGGTTAPAAQTPETEGTTEMDGTWQLEVATPFGKQPATLTFARDNGTLTGHMESRLGNVPLSDIKSGDRDFAAKVSLEMQGRKFDADINGSVEGDQLKGTIKVGIPIAPTIHFTGTRA
ncbi:MAG TPA: pitrilysin family protein [Pyrinomonadaceae bacterium]|nr:pitrilysin family protein [Pyrinomonadaceae bacterium]